VRAAGLGSGDHKLVSHWLRASCRLSVRSKLVFKWRSRTGQQRMATTAASSGPLARRDKLAPAERNGACITRADPADC
jgi:hypothetical protein